MVIHLAQVQAVPAVAEPEAQVQTLEHLEQPIPVEVEVEVGIPVRLTATVGQAAPALSF